MNTLAFMAQKHVSSVLGFYILVDDYGSVSQILWAGFSFSFLRGKSWACVIEINQWKIRLYSLNQWGCSYPVNLFGSWFSLSQTHTQVGWCLLSAHPTVLGSASATVPWLVRNTRTPSLGFPSCWNFHFYFILSTHYHKLFLSYADWVSTECRH